MKIPQPWQRVHFELAQRLPTRTHTRADRAREAASQVVLRTNGRPAREISQRRRALIRQMLADDKTPAYMAGFLSISTVAVNKHIRVIKRERELAANPGRKFARS